MTDELLAAYQRKTDEMFSHLMMRSHQMECDGESQGGKLEAMPGMKGDGARGPFLIDRVEDRHEFVIFEDGYAYYCPIGGGGLTAHNLRTIADELDRRNAPVDELCRRPR